MANGNNSQSNNAQPTQDMNPMSSLNGQQFDSVAVSKALDNLAKALNVKSPTSGGQGRTYARFSQSNYADKQAKWKFEPNRAQEERRKRQGDYKHHGNILDDFEEGIKDQLLDTLAGGDFKKGIKGALDTFEKEFGVQLKDLPHELGKNVGKQLFDAIGDTKLGQNIKNQASSIGNKALGKLFDKAIASGGEAGVNAQAAKDALSNVAKSFFKSGGSVEGMATDVATNVAGGAMTGAMSGEAMAGLAAALPEVAVALAAVAAAAYILGPALEGVAEVAKASAKAMNRENESRKKRLEESQKRLKADIEGLAKIPFDIMEEAANKWASTWDANLSKISLTQGYDKDNVYSLYSSFAERLTEEGLNTLISATDIVDKLSGVIDSGLSGKVAEEFAYTAAKLNAAIPTEDFFAYASTYSSLASAAIANGASQAEAIAYANSQLESFASNLLYSSRELAGGFSTGLKNASDLFNQSVEIARTARITDTAGLSGTLTSVSAIIGAVAPELASGLVSNVVNAAIGGNNDTFVALRSLAGINAGNTEFLRQLAEDPQAIFAKIFTNLASMQSMSPDNYMEVAEGLSSIFGVDMKAFAQIDFNYLASAISQMNINSGSLEENLSLLATGSSQTLAEQQKMEEINRAILDEGLAYVIDNEAARMIQEHMWQEQLALQLQETTYAVELQGSALEFLEGIRQTANNLFNFLNPAGFLAKSISNLVATVAESIGNDQDIREILELGAVGSNSTALYNLTTRGQDLGLTRSLVEMMGGTQGIGWLNTISDLNAAFIPLVSVSSAYNRAWDMGMEGISSLRNSMYASGPSNRATGSRYSWGTVGKSAISALQNSTMNNTDLGAISTISANQAALNEQAAIAQSNAFFQSFLDTAAEASKTMTYEEWKNTARDYGIADYETALKNYGRSESEVSNFFEQYAAKAGAEAIEERKQDEITFRNQMRTFWGLESGDGGEFNANLWQPFYGDGNKYDTRMNAVDTALTTIQNRIGLTESHTVVGGIEHIISSLGSHDSSTVVGVLEGIFEKISNIRNLIDANFVQRTSEFQKYLAGWAAYRTNVATYSRDLGNSAAWSDLTRAEDADRRQTTLALANALQDFSANDLQRLDPQLQANALLGKIVILLEAIMQQNNTAGSINLVDTLQALGLGGGT